MRHLFRVTFYLRSNSTNKQGLSSIMTRIYLDGARISIGASGVTVPASKWDNAAMRVSGKTKQAKEANSKLDAIAAELTTIFTRHEHDESLSLEQVKAIYLGRTRDLTSFLDYFDKYLNDLQAQIGNGKTKATYMKYFVTRKHFASFLNDSRGRADIAPGELDHMIVTDFELYLRTQLGMKQNSAAKTVRFLKTVVLFITRCGAIQRDPFAQYKFNFKQTERAFLTQEEVDRIMSKTMVTQRLENVKDIFIFSCFTGLSYIDIANLTADDIVIIDGKKWIVTSRHKTGIPCHVPLLEIPQKILDKYSKNDNKGKLLPLPSNQKMNAYLKEIADVCGIEKNLTCHVARHTFATLTLTLGASIETVSKMLGHNNITTTQIYAKITSRKVSQEMDNVAAKLTITGRKE